ncbi:MAG: hypothetical protein H7832_07370 [Magnetococcus sp. DMHC-6]
MHFLELGLQWLDRQSWLGLGLIALWLSIAPYPMQPEPHLLEKLRMLVAGTLVKPLDIFDLFLHGIPVVLVIVKAIRQIFPSIS